MIKKSITILLLALSLFQLTVLAQSPEVKVQQEGVSINDNGQSFPRSGSVLDVSSNNKGVIFPQLTEIQRDAITNPSPGLLVYNLDVNLYQYFNGTEWLNLGVPGIPAPPSFNTTWNTANNGVSNNNQISLPLVSSGSYDFTVDWGDGNTDQIASYNQAETTHTYASAGTYEVIIIGTCRGWSFENTTNNQDPLKIILVSEWGIFQPTSSSSNCFKGCSNLNITAIDNLDLSYTTALSFFFEGCSNLMYNASINNWNTASISAFNGMFKNCPVFNQPLGSWDVSLGGNFSNMFDGASTFNQDLLWITIAGNLSNMFLNALNFNGNISAWDVSNATNMTRLFSGATDFNQNISAWDVSNVTGMRQMFLNCASFNQPIGVWGTKVASVGNFSDMLKGCVAFNQNLTSWTPVSATTMQAMFDGCTAFNQPMTWNIPICTNIVRMFRNCVNLDQDYSAWTISSITDIKSWFEGCSSFDQNLSGLDWEQITEATAFLLGVTLSTTNYDALLVGINSQTIQPNVVAHFGNSIYTSGGAAEAARSSLIGSNGWTITDGGSN